MGRKLKKLRRGKSKKVIIFIFVLVVVLIISGTLVYYYLFGLGSKGSRGSGGGVGSGGGLANPAEGLSFEEAVEQFDEDFVFYLLRSIGAGDLRNPPLSSNTPKIEIYVGDDIYNAEVKKGRINVDLGEIDEEDIIIYVTKEEAVKMVLDRSYVSDSFSSGKSSIELSAGKIELASKGYLKIYDNLSS